MTQIKGTSIRGLLKYAKDNDYPGGAQGLVAGLPQALAEDFRRPILSTGWYPYDAFATLLHRLDEELGSGDGALAPEIGHWAAARDAGTIFKMVAIFASAEKIMSMTPFFWSRYCDTGSFKTLHVEPGRGAAQLRDFPAVDPLHCRLLEGWITGIGEASGAENAEATQTRCVHRGDDCCEYTALWD
jgi:hypothetical protein